MPYWSGPTLCPPRRTLAPLQPTALFYRMMEAPAWLSMPARVFVQLPYAVVRLDDGVHRTLLHVHALVALKKKREKSSTKCSEKKSNRRQQDSFWGGGKNVVSDRKIVRFHGVVLKIKTGFTSAQLLKRRTIVAVQIKKLHTLPVPKRWQQNSFYHLAKSATLRFPSTLDAGTHVTIDSEY